MRITQQMILQNALGGLLSNLKALHSAQREIATGRRVDRISDSPLDAAVIMKLDAQVRGLERYRRSASAAQTKLSAEDAVLETVGKLVRQVRELASGGASSPEDPLRAVAIKEARSVWEQVVSLGNTVVAGEYIFAGRNVDVPPFQEDGTYVGDSEARVTQIGEGLTVEANHTGDRLFTAVLDALDALATELESGTPESIEAAVSDLDTAERAMRSARGEIGSRIHHVEEVVAFHARRSNLLLDQKQELQDADPTESALKLTEAQASLERAYAAVSRILSTNILQFLR